MAGVLFGIVMIKSEAASWYRIQEMFRFQSFHMYGIIGTAVAVGASAVYLIKKFRIKTINGEPIQLQPKQQRRYNYILGGFIFGLGWALTGACPGPMFVNIGYGYLTMLIVVLGALAGTFLYGAVGKYLPH